MDEQLSLFKRWIHTKQLLYLEFVLKKVGRHILFGRLLKIDQKKKTILFYDVDKKQVLSIMLNEIDCIQPAELTTI